MPMPNSDTRSHASLKRQASGCVIDVSSPRTEANACIVSLSRVPKCEGPGAPIVGEGTHFAPLALITKIFDPKSNTMPTRSSSIWLRLTALRGNLFISLKTERRGTGLRQFLVFTLIIHPPPESSIADLSGSSSARATRLILTPTEFIARLHNKHADRE